MANVIENNADDDDAAAAESTERKFFFLSFLKEKSQQIKFIGKISEQ